MSFLGDICWLITLAIVSESRRRMAAVDSVGEAPSEPVPDEVPLREGVTFDEVIGLEK